MPLGDSSLQPISMTPLQIIWPSPNSNMRDSEDGGSYMLIQGLIMRLELLKSSNLALLTEVDELTNMIDTIESENISLKKQLNENKEQDALHPPSDTLDAEILNLKNKQEEIRSQQVAFKHETKTHQLMGMGS
jgi:hypothetical protein